jgi:CheY-like chemotaxis protein
MSAAPILVAGLDSRSLLFEAPVLLRDHPMLAERATARELLDGLAREGGRLVVLGPVLPDLALPEAIRRIRSLPDTRRVSILVLLPADEPPGAEQEVVEAGANAVLRRPLDRVELEHWITKLLHVPRRVEARMPVHGQVVGTARGAQRGHFYGLSRNLSINGMLLASPVRLDAPDLDLELQLPEALRIRALGRVVRDAVEVGWPYLGYGVEFLFVPPDSLTALARLVGTHVPPVAPRVVAPRPLIRATMRLGPWIYEIVEPAPYASGFLVEIRRGPREGWRPGLSGPFYVVEGPSEAAALRAAREFVQKNA